MGCSGGKIKENNQSNNLKQNLITTKTKEIQEVKSKTEIKITPKINTSGFITQNKDDPTKVYQVLSFLGQGGFSKAFKVKHKRTGEIRAAKNFDRGVLDMQEGDKKIPIEIDIQRVLSHPNICKAYEWFDYDDGFLLVTELLQGGNLVELLEKYKLLTESEVTEVMKQLLSAVYYLHSNNIMHRDLKLNNIMVEFDDERNFSIKVIDFGLGTYFKEGQRFNQFMGTPPYMSPELINGDYNFLSDIWSCGVIMFILLFGDIPWGEDCDENELYSNIKGKEIDWEGAKKFSGFSEMAIDLMSKMLERNLAERYTAMMCLQHPLFSQKIKSEAQPQLEQVAKNVRKFISGNELQIATSAYIVYHFENANKNKKLKEFFKEIDKSGDGRLTKSELKKGFGSIMKNDAMMKDFDKVFMQINTDGSDYIDYNEFIRACSNYDDLMSENMIKEAFQHFDVDKSGYLDNEELRKALGVVGNSEQEKKILKKILDQTDLNKDGKISFDEFKNLILKINDKKE
jgi:calcium-dependent protein kinase